MNINKKEKNEDCLRENTTQELEKCADIIERVFMNLLKIMGPKPE